MVMLACFLVVCICSLRHLTGRCNDQKLHVQADLASLWSCPLLCGTLQVGHPRIIREVTIQSYSFPTALNSQQHKPA